MRKIGLSNSLLWPGYCSAKNAGTGLRRILASGADDQQELARRGGWLLQTAIADVARRERSRSPSRQLSAPEIRQNRASGACRFAANDRVEAVVGDGLDLAPPRGDGRDSCRA